MIMWSSLLRVLRLVQLLLARKEAGVDECSRRYVATRRRRLNRRKLKLLLLLLLLRRLLLLLLLLLSSLASKLTEKLLELLVLLRIWHLSPGIVRLLVRWCL